MISEIKTKTQSVLATISAVHTAISTAHRSESYNLTL